MSLIARTLLALVSLSGLGLARPGPVAEPPPDLVRLGAELEVEVSALLQERDRLRTAAEEAATSRRSALASLAGLRRRIDELTELEAGLREGVQEIDEALVDLERTLE